LQILLCTDWGFGYSCWVATFVVTDIVEVVAQAGRL